MQFALNLVPGQLRSAQCRIQLVMKLRICDSSPRRALDRPDKGRVSTGHIGRYNTRGRKQ